MASPRRARRRPPPLRSRLAPAPPRCAASSSERARAPLTRDLARTRT
eukprot:CAMPEP_0118867296 /NCGR_PEP_ID=MMETSP1163-20130328/10949_1 /TAXON_ID=124430 /ORGANISM="Phaeomonas parva, Strain CCMP2877" /LENGTH=46 /DNA_ID= /DNA_START= /DNA_END= /DNA_ORIENTATION=